MSDRPVFTRVHPNTSAFQPRDGSVYVFARSEEFRSAHIELWHNSVQDVQLIQIADLGTEIEGHDIVRDKEVGRFRLRGQVAMERFWISTGAQHGYLDITGLSHHVWAPLLKSGLQVLDRLDVVYVEPGHYSFNLRPTEGQIFDLSDRIDGIRPLPGFASIRHSAIDEFILVPLLGFEGMRLAYVIEQLQPSSHNIVPVVGVPGFRAEYPFYAFEGNRRSLTESEAWKRVTFATANCPFDLFNVLASLAEYYNGKLMKLAIIGTKPHALGAVLYKLANDLSVELIYDHPIRKSGRTAESDRVLEYPVSRLFK